MIAYFETSAVVKLVVEETGSQVAQLAWEAADRIVVGRITEPEARAALAAAVRAGRLDRDELEVARSHLRWRLDRAVTVELSAPVARAAGDLAERLALRGYDAVHLATVLAVGPGVTLVTWDRALRKAARGEGVPLVPHRLS